MELEVEEYPAFASGSLRGLEEELDESLETDAFEKPQETPQTLGPAEGSAMSDVSTASATNCLLTAPLCDSSTPSDEASKDGDEKVAECTDVVSEDLSRRIADDPMRVMNELQTIEAISSSTTNVAVKEEISSFDIDAWPGLAEETSEELMVMDSFEYDEESSELRKSPATTCEASKKKSTAAQYRGLFSTCNGYRMRSMHANKKGEIYWRCAKQSRLKCSGAATSDLDAANLVEIRPHNHSVDGGHPILSRAASKARSDGESVGRSRKRKQPNDGEHVPRLQVDRRAKADAIKLLAQLGDGHDDEEAESPRALGVPDMSTPMEQSCSSNAIPSVAHTYSTPETAGTSQSTVNKNTAATKPEQASSSVWNFKSREAMRNPDVVLHVNEAKLYAHKAILAAISPVFDEAFRRCVGPLIDYNMNSDGIGPQGLEVFLQSIYPCGNEPTEDYLPQLGILANHYDIKPLKRKCLERVRVSRSLSNLDKLKVAVKSDAVELEDQVLASFTKDDIRQLLQSDCQHQLGEQRLLKLLAKAVSL